MSEAAIPQTPELNLSEKQREQIAEGRNELAAAVFGAVGAEVERLGEKLDTKNLESEQIIEKSALAGAGVVMGVIDEHYHLIPREGGDSAPLPATVEAWNSLNGSGEFKAQLDLSGELKAMFDIVNN